MITNRVDISDKKGKVIPLRITNSLCCQRIGILATEGAVVRVNLRSIGTYVPIANVVVGPLTAIDKNAYLNVDIPAKDMEGYIQVFESVKTASVTISLISREE